MITEINPGYPAHLVEKFQKKTPKSRAEYARAAEILPFGSPGGLGLVVVPHEVYIERGEGCHIWDMDGNRYLDMFCGDWLLPLGHCNPQVKAAITEQLAKGTTFGGPAANLGYELATLIQKRMPSIEMMRFATSGTEANANAVRLARTFTKRGKIAKLFGGYHGSADILIISNGLNTDPNYLPPGMLPGTEREVVLLPPNNIAACKKIIEREKDNLAAILLEPIMGVIGFVSLTHEYVKFMREITKKYGIVLIFDEVVTMPLGSGGAQGYFGVAPDLTTFGKTIGGGLPLAAYGGRRDIMGLLDPHQHNGMPPLGIAATMGGMPVCLAAGIAAVKQFTPEFHRHLHALGDRVRSGINALGQKHKVPLQATGIGQFFAIHWTPTKVVDYASYTTGDHQIVANLVFSLAVQGFIGSYIGTFHLSTPMTTTDIDLFLVAMEQALRDYKLIS